MQQKNKIKTRMKCERPVSGFIEKIGGRWEYPQILTTSTQNILKEGKEKTEKDYQESVAKIKKELEQKEKNALEMLANKLQGDFTDLKNRMKQMETNLNAKITKQEWDKKNLESLKRELEKDNERLREDIGQKPDDCFALDTKVQLASGKLVEMVELQVGDLVLSNVKNNHVKFSEVYLISHLGHYDYPLNMVKIEFTNPTEVKDDIYTLHFQ
ncbi:hypothetical protein Glove_395g1 [Diversispora epigaea]|uniref:Uncharacterized protein n=1 Tax=Diversispora epigaea TaxID=1348612 RepID=A0A397H222_9GLOM|nr:hypothetical protein Glove_395g1 [Diversispora epigaea]